MVGLVDCVLALCLDYYSGCVGFAGVRLSVYWFCGCIVVVFGLLVDTCICLLCSFGLCLCLDGCLFGIDYVADYKIVCVFRGVVYVSFWVLID